MITITCRAREGASKGNIRRLRREGLIPYVMYSKGQEAFAGVLQKSEFEAALRSIRPGFLSTTVFALKNDAGQETRVVVREVQYEPTTYSVIHLDFLKLEEDRAIELKVPLECINSVDCVGVKLGGLLRSLARHVKVRCTPSNIPTHFDIDVKELGIRQVKRVKDIALPAGVTCLTNLDDVIVTVAKK